MFETTCDIWQPKTWNLELEPIETLWLCITTNGYIKKNGCAVMGAGVAKQARDRFDGLDRLLGEKLKEQDQAAGMEN